MSEKPRNKENRKEVARAEEEQYRKNGEAKFASPENDSTGIGYYDEHGNQLSPDEFQVLVARDAERLRDDEDDG